LASRSRRLTSRSDHRPVRSNATAFGESGAAAGARTALELVDGIEPSTSPLPRECSTTELHEPAWSGRRDSNPRHSAWEADALPTELLPRTGNASTFPKVSGAATARVWWVGLDSNQRRHSQRIYSPSPLTTRAPTQAPRFFAAGVRAWSHPSESNRQPSDYKSDALPIELGWQPSRRPEELK